MMPMILVIVVAAAWMVILGPNLVKRRSQIGRAGSISHFHRQQSVLKRATPAPVVSPAYRLRSDPAAGASDRYPDVSAVPVLTVVGADQLPRPALAFLGEQIDRSESSVTLPLAAPELDPSNAGQMAGPPAWRGDRFHFELSDHERLNRQQTRRRRRDTLATLTLVFVLSGLVGFIPGAGAAWVAAGASGIALAFYVSALVHVQRAVPRGAGGASLPGGATVHALDSAARARAASIGGVGVPVYMSGRFAHPSNQAVAVR